MEDHIQKNVFPDTGLVDTQESLQVFQTLFEFYIFCDAIQVAIIVPYRDRDDHLRTFLLNIHKFLQPQQLDYGIYFGEYFVTHKLTLVLLAWQLLQQWFLMPFKVPFFEICNFSEQTKPICKQ